MSIDELLQLIAGANTEADNLVTQYASAKEAADGLAAQFAGLNAEGTSATLSQAAQLLGEIPGLIAAVKAKAEGASSVTESPKGLGAHGALALGAQLAEERPLSPPPTPFNPKRHNPACWQGLAPYRDVDTAQGNLFYPDGTRWNTEPIQAHRGNAEDNARGLKPEYAGMRAVWHVEGSVAAWMREEKQSRMVVYLNTTRCTYIDGCREQLHKLLPKSSVLIVHGVQRNGKPTRLLAQGRQLPDEGVRIRACHSRQDAQRTHLSDALGR